MAFEERRRHDDGLILKMHGNIETLLERTKNIDKMDDRISRNEGSILGMKWVGGLFSLIFGGALTFFKRG